MVYEDLNVPSPSLELKDWSGLAMFWEWKIAWYPKRCTKVYLVECFLEDSLEADKEILPRGWPTSWWRDSVLSDSE